MTLSGVYPAGPALIIIDLTIPLISLPPPSKVYMHSHLIDPVNGICTINCSSASLSNHYQHPIPSVPPSLSLLLTHLIFLPSLFPCFHYTLPFPSDPVCTVEDNDPVSVYPTKQEIGHAFYELMFRGITSAVGAV